MVSTRFDYIQYDEVHTAISETFKKEFVFLEQMIKTMLPEGREKSLVLTNLEQTYMWIDKSLKEDQIKVNGEQEHLPSRNS